MSVVRLTRAEVLAKIEALYDSHPMLRTHEPKAVDKCCQIDEVAELYGWPAAWVWDEIQTYKWLLGDEE